VPALGDLLSRVVTIDLFEPPQRERIRKDAVRLQSDGLTQRDIAKCVSEPATQAAVCDALALERMIREKGLASPYIFVGEPPEDYHKLCRHQNPKYRFEPIEGYLPPSL
jgi:hypothetical protein